MYFLFASKRRFDELLVDETSPSLVTRRASHLTARAFGRLASRMSSRGSVTGKVLLALVVALLAPPTAGQLASDAREPASSAPTPPLSVPNLAPLDRAAPAVPGGGLHEDASTACGGCAAVAHQLRRLLERPPRRPPVTEIDPATGSETQVPFSKSREFLTAALRRACEPVSLASFERGRTWLGDTTWHPDSLPFFPEHEKPVDEDLRSICLKALDPNVGAYADAFLYAVAHRGDPHWVCRETLGCGALLGSVTFRSALLETLDKLIRKNPSVLLKLAPVFLVAFVTPLLFRPMFAPPSPPGNQSDALEAVRAARAARAETKASVSSREKTKAVPAEKDAATGSGAGERGARRRGKR
jgi:hypothetical protein